MADLRSHPKVTTIFALRARVEELEAERKRVGALVNKWQVQYWGMNDCGKIGLDCADELAAALKKEG